MLAGPPSPYKFLSTPSARRATTAPATPKMDRPHFYPRPPRGGRRRDAVLTLCRPGISIHALREEGDPSRPRNHGQAARFLSTPSARRATPAHTLHGWPPLDFYPRPPRGGRRIAHCKRMIALYISIHALREEGDVCHQSRPLPDTYFYPRPPRGGRRGGILWGRFAGKISIHALREEGDGAAPDQDQDRQAISIHALREEGDRSWPMKRSLLSNFYPRPPRGGRPLNVSLLEIVVNFYPRPPRGGRRLPSAAVTVPSSFLSTPSARRATGRLQTNNYQDKFLSTPSARRATRILNSVPPRRGYFYPRPPRGGRLDAPILAAPVPIFLSTPSARRATVLLYVASTSGNVFLSTPSARRAT